MSNKYVFKIHTHLLLTIMSSFETTYSYLKRQRNKRLENIYILFKTIKLVMTMNVFKTVTNSYYMFIIKPNAS